MLVWVSAQLCNGIRIFCHVLWPIKAEWNNRKMARLMGRAADNQRTVTADERQR